MSSPAEQPTECPICVESYNRSSRRATSCIKCDLVCCKTCFKRYIMDEDHYLSCMSCHVAFDRTSLKERLGLSFMQTIYRDIRKIALYEQEKAYFPATQALIEKRLEINQLRKERDSLHAKYEQIRKDRTIPLNELRVSLDVMKVCEALDKYLQLQSNIEIIDEQLQDERQSISTAIEKLEDKATITKRTYVLACTNAECKGMLSHESRNADGHYVCTVCRHETCHECKMDIREEGHTCDPDVLKSLEYMQSTSKPCPACGAAIHKISGCNQMFCTSCHANFDWRTMRLNNGAVHNPHAAEWMRSQRNRPREVMDVQCGRELTVNVAVDMISDFDYIIDRAHLPQKADVAMRKVATYIFEMMRVAVHHNHTTIVSLSRNQYGHHTNQELRVQLLMKTMSEEQFKSEIQKRDKSMSKRNELLQIVTTYRDALTDIVWPYVEGGSNKTMDEWKGLSTEIKALERYVDNCFERVGGVYGSACYTIASNRTIR